MMHADGSPLPLKLTSSVPRDGKRHQLSREWDLSRTCSAYFSSPRFALQATILTLSAVTDTELFSILKVTFLIRNVQTSSQKRYVSREP